MFFQQKVTKYWVWGAACVEMFIQKKKKKSTKIHTHTHNTKNYASVGSQNETKMKEEMKEAEKETNEILAKKPRPFNVDKSEANTKQQILHILKIANPNAIFVDSSKHANLFVSLYNLFYFILF